MLFFGDLKDINEGRSNSLCDISYISTQRTEMRLFVSLLLISALHIHMYEDFELPLYGLLSFSLDGRGRPAIFRVVFGPFFS